jgi:hypothetical protein
MALYFKANGDTTKAWGGTLTQTHFDDIKALLAKLEVTDIAGNSGTIITEGNWRIDRQNPTKTASNIQVQMNGIGNPSTVAGVLVPDIYTSALNQGTKGLDEDAKKALLGKKSKALHYAFSRAMIQSAATLSDELSSKGKPNGNKCIKMQIICGQFDI